MLDINKLIEVKREKGEWFHRFKRKMTRGLIIDFSYEDSNIGQWKIKAEHSVVFDDVVIKAIWSNKESNIANQLKRGVIQFQPTDNDPSNYYVPLGIGYMNEERFRKQRISNESDLSNEILSNLKIKKYQQVKRNPSKQYNNKLVCVCKKGDYKKMAFAFILQRIYPVQDFL